MSIQTSYDRREQIQTWLTLYYGSGLHVVSHQRNDGVCEYVIFQRNLNGTLPLFYSRSHWCTDELDAWINAEQTLGCWDD